MLKSPPIVNADVNQSFTPEILKGLQAFLSFVNDGMSIEALFDVDAALTNHEVTAAEITYLKSHPEIAQLFEERYIAPTVDLEELLKLSEDSLGFVYASNLRAANFKQGFYPKVELKDDVSYLALRMRQTHDIWHTVTGYGFDPIGGIKLGGFHLAQNRDPVMVMVIAGEIMNTIKMNRDLNQIISFLQEGYDVGTKAKPFLGQKWEDAWEKPIAKWRAELNIPHSNNENVKEATAKVA